MLKPRLNTLPATILLLIWLPWTLCNASPNTIQIEGDSAIFDQARRNVTYTGSVIATQGDLVIAGDKLTVALVEDDVDNIRTIGNPAKFSLRQKPADENSTQYAELKATALTIIFAPAANQLQLLGDATLQQGGNVIRSSEITYDLDAQQIRAEGHSERVRMEFEISGQQSANAPRQP
jgi:lipopolysaccharide transport protein LptA